MRTPRTSRWRRLGGGATTGKACRPGIVFWGNCQTVEFRLFINIIIVQRKQPDQHPGRDGREEQGRPSGTALRLHRLQLQQRVAEDLAVHRRTCGTAGRRRSRSSGRGGGSRMEEGRTGQRISVNRLGYWHLALPNILSNLLYAVS